MVLPVARIEEGFAGEISGAILKMLPEPHGHVRKPRESGHGLYDRFNVCSWGSSEGFGRPTWDGGVRLITPHCGVMCRDNPYTRVEGTVQSLRTGSCGRTDKTCSNWYDFEYLHVYACRWVLC